MLRKPIAVSPTALERMCRVQDLGDLSPFLRGPVRSVDVDTDAGQAEREADHAMWAEFTRLGLVDGSGRLDGDALDTLSCLTSAPVRYLAYVTDGDQWYSIVVAGGGYESVVAWRDSGDVHLRGVRGRSPAYTLIHQLPEQPPARLGSVNLRADGSDRRRAPHDLETLRTLMNEPELGRGELYVSVRDHGVYRSNDDRPVLYADYRSGRMLVTISGGYVSFAPATTDMLVQRLNEEHRLLTEPSW